MPKKRNEPPAEEAPPSLPHAAVVESMAEILQRLGLDAVYVAPYTQVHEAIVSSASDPFLQLEIRDLAKETIRSLLGSRKKLADMLIQALPIAAHHLPVNHGGHLYFNENLAVVVGVANTQQATALLRQASQSSSLPTNQAAILQSLLNPFAQGSKIQTRTSQQVYVLHKKAVGVVKAFKEQLAVIVAGLPPEEPTVEPPPAAAEPTPGTQETPGSV